MVDKKYYNPDKGEFVSPVCLQIKPTKTYKIIKIVMLEKNSGKFQIDWTILASVGKSLIRAFIAAGGITAVVGTIQALTNEFVPAQYLPVALVFIEPLIKFIQKWATDYSNK